MTTTTNEVLERDLRLQAVALLALVKHGIRADIQGLLIGGDERGTVGPGALLAAVRAVRKQVLADLLPVSEEVVEAMASAPGMKEVDAMISFCAARNPAHRLGWAERGEPAPLAQAFTAAITAITAGE